MGQSSNAESIPVIRRNEEVSTERRLGQLLYRLEKKLDEDSASSLSYDDIAFQLADLKDQVQEMAQERSKGENLYYWLLLFLSFVSISMMTYLSSFLVNALR